MNIKELYQELIIDHGTHPRNCRPLEDATEIAEGFNPLCGDKVKIFLKTKNQELNETTFLGSGCAICMASASLMTECMKGKTVCQILEFSAHFKALLTGKTSEDLKYLPSTKLDALLGVRSFPSRIKCATLPWHTLEAAIQKSTIPVTTEEIG